MRRFITGVTLAAFVGFAQAQTVTTFTYQGSLTDTGSPATGTYSMTFSLFDALTGGAQVGSTINIASQAVSTGVFTSELDFGAAITEPAPLWLEIGVNGSALTPRQALTATPFSIQTRGIYVDENLRVGVNTTNPSEEAQLHVTDTTGDNFAILADSFGVQGSSIGLHTGPSGYSSLAKNAFFKAGWRYFDPGMGAYLQEVDPAGNVFFLIAEPSVDPGNPPISWKPAISMKADTGYLGIGTFSPQDQLHVETNTGNAVYARTNDPVRSGVSGYHGTSLGSGSGVRGQSLSTGGTGVFGLASAPSGSNSGVAGFNSSTSGQGVWGRASSATGFVSGVYGESLSDSGVGVYGRASASGGMNYGVYGRSDGAAGYDFFAGGVGIDYGTSSSIRWKNNVRNIDSPLDKLAALRGVYFDWDEAHGGAHDVGMIAEEVGKVLPEIVAFEEDGEYAHGMDYAKLTPLLVEAVNALRSEKDAEIVALSERIVQLETLVNQLTSSDKE